MQKPNLSQARWHPLLFLIPLVVIAVDQMSKYWIKTHLAIGESLFDFGFFQITRVQNTGAAFGIFRGYAAPLSIISILGVIIILVYIYYFHRRYPIFTGTFSKVAIMLVLGGDIGNLIDRVAFGYVTDFLDFKIWPSFNVADSCLVIGVIMLVYSLIFLMGKSEEK